MHTLLAHVEKSGTHLMRWKEGEKGHIHITYIRNNHNHMHHNVLGDVGMHYSLPVIFHVFPVVKRRENSAVISKDH